MTRNIVFSCYNKKFAKIRKFHLQQADEKIKEPIANQIIEIKGQSNLCCNNRAVIIVTDIILPIGKAEVHRSDFFRW